MTTDRREFIKKSLYSVLALLGLGFLAPAFRVLAPAKSETKELAYFPLLAEDDVPRIGVKKAELQYITGGKTRKARVFVVSSERGLDVFSAVCSHLGCLVNYQREKREFVCPCHGGKYDLSGGNIGGPPPAPLTKFPVVIQDGVVLVGVKV